MNILEQIIADKRVEIARKKEALPFIELEARALGCPVPPDFASALRSAPIGLIAEVKRRSPSAGIIRDPFDPAVIAREYEAAGAHAISCLMDEPYFGGGEADFSAVRAAVSLPMLYKEFVVDPWQIAHARTLGASAVLLIVGALSDEELSSFIGEVRRFQLIPLVEVHDEEEMSRAISAGADCLGINNRNLKTFETTLETTFRLKQLAPPSALLISESGIKTSDDVRLLKEGGIQALLVGESLLREASPGQAVQNLLH